MYSESPQKQKMQKEFWDIPYKQFHNAEKRQPYDAAVYFSKGNNGGYDNAEVVIPNPVYHGGDYYTSGGQRTSGPWMENPLISRPESMYMSGARPGLAYNAPNNRNYGLTPGGLLPRPRSDNFRQPSRYPEDRLSAELKERIHERAASEYYSKQRANHSSYQNGHPRDYQNRGGRHNAYEDFPISHHREPRPDYHYY